MLGAMDFEVLELYVSTGELVVEATGVEELYVGAPVDELLEE